MAGRCRPSAGIRGGTAPAGAVGTGRYSCGKGKGQQGTACKH